MRAAGDQLAAALAQVDEGDADALGAAAAARQQFAAALATHDAAARLQCRQQWVHCGERPSPTLTARLRLPQQLRRVPALRSATGQLLTRGTACAQRVADFWAGVSAQPAIDPAARQEVMAALAQGPHFTPDQAATLGDTTVTTAEVLTALKTARPGRAPGHDGIPVELYRRLRAAWAPLLARLFTAIATTGQLPPRFHEGVITILFKGAGDAADPAGYRPITVLCTDYRLWAKVLANRLNPCLNTVIDPAQTAFVPGRRIGENIMTLQCLPTLLQREGRWACAVFCDFAKAYDTVDRAFLLDALGTLGAGAGFVALVRPLLQGTAARACVNDWVSTPAESVAGVRQGCPLAPLLYLFVAQALLRLLTARGVGIDVAGRRLMALQYADDTVPLLPDLGALPPFLDAMATFHRATGQRLNPAKTKVLPLGAVPAGLPDAAHGLAVTATATTLGVVFGAAADPTARWPDRLAGVERCYAKLAGLSLSAFGRGMASAAYGVSKFLYHAEFTGMPPQPTLDRIVSVTTRLVDTNRAPAPLGHGGGVFVGVAGWLLPGRPRNGGFGTLPLREHIRARWAWWGARLVTAPLDDPPPWVAVARALFRSIMGPQLGSHTMGLLYWPANAALPGRPAGDRLPAPLRRLHEGLAAVPAQPIGPAPLEEAGPWCWAAPLWGNPLLRSPAFPDGIDWDFADVAAARVGTVGDLLAAQAAVAAHLGSAAAYAHHVWGPRFHHYGPFADRHHATDRLAQLAAALPPAWVAAAGGAGAAVAAGALAPPAAADAMAAITGRLGWTVPREPEPVPLAAITVRAATAVQRVPAERQRQAERLAPFAEACGGTPDRLREAFARLWRLPWENKHKEPFWRLVYNAFPTAARLHLDRPCACGGGGPRPDRTHNFWDCPVAAAVRGCIDAALAEAQPGAAPVTRSRVWLPASPAGVYAGVWDVVCLAALAAMDKGRRLMAAAFFDPAPPPPAALVARSIRAARAHFWCALADFVALQRIPAAWRQRCPPAHPFICYDPGTAAWEVNRPIVAPATPDQ